ncbi:MAG: flagellar motor protein MotB [Burkholderiales bacterium]|nr:flagellar motor protein MotB [Burkholderiales bacterium]
MAGDAKKLQPIIIKKVKKGGHAAHGGAWKIAYADFVTAMMAFFLLMWLLGSTTEGDKKGIADYFASPLKVALLGGGSGSGDSSHVVKGGGEDLSRSNGQVRRGDVEATRSTINLHVLKEQQRKAEISKLEELKEKVESELRNNARLAQFSAQIKLDMTRDGLRIQIVDELNRPMFDSGSAVVKPYMRELLRAIGSVLGEVPNRLTLEGHTDGQPFGANDRGYSNWELSADRANASRRELMAGGLEDNRVLRVLGLASSSLFTPDDPFDPQNRRISIIVMNREAEDRFFRPKLEAENAPEAASAPKSEPSIRPERPMLVSSQPIVGR